MSKYTNRIKAFKMVAPNYDYNGKRTYLYKFTEFSNDVDKRSEIFFDIYATLFWFNYNVEMRKTFEDKELQNQKFKENKEKYFELVQNFLNKVVSSNNFYLKGKGKRWNWKLDDVRARENTWMIGFRNRNYFYLSKDTTVSITTPSFEINKTGENEYMFEKDLLNANFYLKNFIWNDYKLPNPYVNDKEFVKRLDTMITKIRDENLRTFQNIDKIYKDLKNKAGLKLTEIENSFKDIEKKLRKVISTYNTKLTIAEYENIIDFANITKTIDELQDPTNYGDYGLNRALYYFKEFLNENEYLKKHYSNSFSKEELDEIKMYKEQENFVKVNEINKNVIIRFFKNSQKTITDLFLENKILSVNHKQEMLKDTVIEELERD